MLNWSVTYKNGEVHEHSSTDFKTSDIDSEQLDVITLKDPYALVPALILHFDDKRKKPIFLMRRQLPNANTPFEIRCHIVGWQMNINGTNIQSINYLFETIDRKIMVKDDTHPKGEKEIIQEMCWMESAGKFDRSRDSWFKSPSERQLAILGSKVKENK